MKMENKYQSIKRIFILQLKANTIRKGTLMVLEDLKNLEGTFILRKGSLKMDNYMVMDIKYLEN